VVSIDALRLANDLTLLVFLANASRLLATAIADPLQTYPACSIFLIQTVGNWHLSSTTRQRYKITGSE
jgi:hypothetical protein